MGFVAMVYQVLADIVVFVHFLWILFLIFGAFWGVRNKKVKLVHISGLVFAVTIQVFSWYCPLTHLEAWLRSKQDATSSYTGSFIAHYAEKIVYIELPSSLIFILTVFLIGITSWLYLKRRPQR
ncbi:MAG: DUF2784 domain-containing protein [Nitrospirae bacterium]|nr:DUF2784 domain-containing protein [Nitrospirota bacterium]